MDRSWQQVIEERLNRLEQELAELRAMLKQHGEASGSSSEPAPSASPTDAASPRQTKLVPNIAPGGAAPPKASERRPRIPDHMRSLEYWLNKVGIGLVLFAVIFLFKYSVDQGWLTPTVRVVMGLALGVVLIILALRLYRRNPGFSLALFGGGIATFYITTFAAFQWYTLVVHPVAYLFLIAVAFFSVTIALRLGHQALAVIGVAGALITPFLLYTGQDNVTGLMMYTSIIIIAVAVMFFSRSWRGLFWLTMAGGWLIMAVAVVAAGSMFQIGDASKQIAVQLGIGVCWLACWAVPLVRDVYGRLKPDRFHYKELSASARSRLGQLQVVIERHTHLLTVSTPLLALILSIALWESETDRQFWGWVTMGLAGCYGLIAYRLNLWGKMQNLAFTHFSVGLLLLTAALAMLLEGDTLLVTVATEALVLVVIGDRVGSRTMATYGYLLYAGVGLWMFQRFSGMSQDSTIPLVNERALSELWALATAFVVAYRANLIGVRRAFLLLAFALLAMLFVRDVEGNLLLALLTAEAAVVHLVGRRITDRFLVAAGHVLVVLLAILMFGRLVMVHIEDTMLAYGNPPLLNVTTLCDVLYAAMLFGVSYWFTGARVRGIYRIGFHAIVLALLLRELYQLENGQGIVTICWFVYALGLIIAGLRRDAVRLRTLGAATLGLVIGKLFLVDLANLETIWRILLFFGLGGVLLFVSYYFKLLWKRD